MKQSWRCTRCAINWPKHDARGHLTDMFERCPDCDGPTWESSDPPTETWPEVNYSLFERYLRARPREDRSLMERVEPMAFAQYLMDAAEEQTERSRDVPQS
jgi:NAD-dependent SIR2 family protein deacetylase